MREIKFRGKSVETGEWIYDDLIHMAFTAENKSVPVGIKSPYNCYPVEVVPETVGQYTESHDKNGKEIYEGDIACVPYIDCIFGDLVGKDIDYDFKFIVNFKDASFVLSNKDRGNIYINEFGNNIEIIGNIHDNPELLEVTK
ncbi:MAG: YopX family protein [Oscillospiraceae bacterium]|jgi:uncharacterized phage protein (TIGR01671 family)